MDAERWNASSACGLEKQAPRLPERAVSVRVPLNPGASLVPLHQRLLNPKFPQTLNVGQAFCTACRLYTSHATAYVLWGLLTTYLMNCVSVYGNAFWFENHEDEPGQPVMFLMYLPFFLLFPLTYGPFAVASNTLRPHGSGFTWSALFLTGFKKYCPLLAYSLTFVGICLACFLSNWVPLFLLSQVADSPTPLVIPITVSLCAYMAIRFCFAANLFLEYHKGIGFFEAMSLSFKVTGRVFWQLVRLSLSCAAFVLPSALCVAANLFLFAPVFLPYCEACSCSIARLAVAYVSWLPLAALSVPFVSLTFAAAFDQVFGMNDCFIEDTEDSVICSV